MAHTMTHTRARANLGRRRRPGLAGVLLGLLASTAIATTAAPRMAIAEEPLHVQARAAADRALTAMRRIATRGGWVWRYSLDLSQRAGESQASPTMIWVQPPGTPSVGMALLRAFSATGDRRWLDAAKEAADALAAGQLDSGGWDYSIDFDPAARKPQFTNFDDDTTQSAVRFLLALVDADPVGNDVRDRQIRAACDRALEKMLEAQYPNGAWPQRYDGRPRDPGDFPVRRAVVPASWPREWPKADYRQAYTLNDGTLRDCVGVMFDAFRRRGDARYRDAACRAGEFLILAQLPQPQAAWAQQYDRAMQPSWARAFEPPAVTAGESVGAVRTLVDIFHATGDRKYLAPIPAAIDWWRRSEIAPGRWARFYELGTNRPIYGDRDGRIRYRLYEISPERRTGYGWEGEFGVAGAIRAYERALAGGPRPSRPGERAAPSEGAVRKVIDALDDRGRWVTRGRFVKEVKGLEFDDRIETSAFIENLDVLSAFLAANRTEKK